MSDHHSPRLAVLASGGGSNLQAILDAIELETLPAVVALVISNNSHAGALARARKAGVPTMHLSSTTHPEPGSLARAMNVALEAHCVDRIVLAGYMKRLDADLIARWSGKIVNIHPALLPGFGGVGMFGLRVHEAVLAAGAKETGITIHLVDAEYDHGPILFQTRCPIPDGIDAEGLQRLVLVLEHAHYPKVIANWLGEEMQNAECRMQN